jgi:hypothetical protein
LPSSSLKGLSSLILFPLFANGVIDTGGKQRQRRQIATVTPLSTTLAKLVAKFAAGVVDTGGEP